MSNEKCNVVYAAKVGDIGDGKLASSIRFGAAKIDTKVAEGKMGEGTANTFFDKLMSYVPKIGTDEEEGSLVAVSQLIGGINGVSEKVEVPASGKAAKKAEKVKPVKEEKPKKEKEPKPVKEKKVKEPKPPKEKKPKAEKVAPVVVEEVPEEPEIVLPDSEDELFAMAEESINERKYVTADACLTKILDSDAENTDALMLKGIAAAKAGNWPYAANIWKKLFAINSGCDVMKVWTAALAEIIFNDVKATKRSVDVSFIHRILTGAGLSKAGCVYEHVFNKILKYDYADAEMKEVFAHMLTREMLIKSAVYGGNSIERNISRCAKWADLMESYDAFVKEKITPDRPLNFFQKRTYKWTLSSMDKFVTESEDIRAAVKAGLEDVKDADQGKIKEYWTANNEKRFDLYQVLLITDQKYSKALSTSVYHETPEEVLERYGKWFRFLANAE